MNKAIRRLWFFPSRAVTAVKCFFEKHNGYFAALLVLITLLRIFIGCERGLQECALPHDDLLYLQLAHKIANGHWLGGFYALTMAKSCIFPCYIALSMLSGLPYLVFVDLTICCVCYLGLLALRPHLNRFWALLLYSCLIFNPAYFFYQRLVIQDLFATLVLGLLFCLIACWIRRTYEMKGYWPWFVGAGLFFSLVCHTREEGLAILSVWAGVCVLLLLNMVCRKECRRKIAAHAIYFILTPVCLYFCVDLPIRALNLYRYGIFETCLRNNSVYKKFIGSLFGAGKQLDPEWDVRIPLRREVLARLYELSPALKRLKPFMDRSPWPQCATDRFPAEILKKTPALISNTKGGFLQWELLDAMSSIGYFRKNNWNETKEFMQQVVSDLKKATDEGKLPGFRIRCSNLPPYSNQMAKWFFTKFSWDAKYLFFWGKKFIFLPRLFLRNDVSPEVSFYYAPLKNNEIHSVNCYKISGWGHIPREKKQIGMLNFSGSPIHSFKTVNRKDVQSVLTKQGYPAIPADAGFSFYLQGDHLRVNDPSGKIIFSGDVRKTRGANGVFLDEVVKLKPLSAVRCKRLITYGICAFCRAYGLYITLLSGLLAILCFLYGFRRPAIRWKTFDLLLAGGMLWGTGFMYFCLIILANVVLHCPRNAGYFMPAFALIYSACAVFILGSMSILCSGRTPDAESGWENRKSENE